MIKKEIVIDNGELITLQKVIGFAFPLLAIFWFINHMGKSEWFDWLYSIAFTLNGVCFLIRGFGLNTIKLKDDNNTLEIKWMGSFKVRQLKNEDIELILLNQDGLQIKNKNGETNHYKTKGFEDIKIRKLNDFFRMNYSEVFESR